MATKLSERLDKIDRDILMPMVKPGKAYWIALGLCVFFVLVAIGAWIYQLKTGLGAAGIRHPGMWGFYIINFVFWVGIAHSGTLISAVLLLFRANFRSAFNRSAEAMTIFAVMTAGLFPIIHAGRPWKIYWLFPYPTQREIWPNFFSPLEWDVFAVSTYFTISLIFWYLGMVPDLAIARRFFGGVRGFFYRLFSLGWTGTVPQWMHYVRASLFLAAFATPLVASVHSVVSFDFAVSIVPGWHATIFPPFFVAGAIFSGCAMVFTLVIPMRKIFKLEEYITIDHFENLAKLTLFTGLIVTYAYITEFTLPLYGENVFERDQFIYRAFGDYKWYSWAMIFCNSVVPLILFIKSMRRNLLVLFVVSIFINIGMWLERFVIVVISLAHEYEPYSWGLYHPSIVEILITIGSFAWFFMWFLLFTRAIPVVSIFEVKEERVREEGK